MKTKPYRQTSACPWKLRFFGAFAALLALLVTGETELKACSAVASSHEVALLGGNYDWSARGGIVFVSPRYQVKSALSFVGEKEAVRWTSAYGSVTLSQFGRDFPMQGINEAGLAGMVLVGESQYPEDGPHGTLTENLWLQYQLDQFSTVKQVVAHAGDFGIRKLSASLHWFLCDKQGDCAVIEFLAGKPVIHTGENLPVPALTNTTYDKAMAGFEAWLKAQPPLPRGYPSLSRFIRLAANSDRGSEVAISEALNDVVGPGFTAWQTVFNLQKGSFRSRLERGEWYEFRLSDLSFHCGSTAGMFDLSEGEWTEYDHILVDELFERSAIGASGLGPEVRRDILSHTGKMSCAGK